MYVRTSKHSQECNHERSFLMSWFWDDDGYKRDSDGSFWDKDEAERAADNGDVDRMSYGYRDRDTGDEFWGDGSKK